MSEAAAIEKLENLITESHSGAAPLLFPLDQREIVREIEVIYDEDTRVTLYHKLRWPSYDALIERQRQTSQKVQSLGSRKNKVQSDDGVSANAKLWDKFVSQVRGYEWNGIDPDEWVNVSDDLAAEIPSEHKSEAIVGLFESKFEVEWPKSKGYVLGAVTYKVKQTYGPYTIWHVFNKLSDRDRRDLSRKSQETQYETGPGAKREVLTNLKPYVDVYDKIFDRLEGVSGSDPNIAQRKDLINALWKLSAIDALIERFEANRRDLSKN